MHSSGSTVDRGLLGERPDVVGGRVGHQRDEMGDVRRAHRQTTFDAFAGCGCDHTGDR